jgi:hypothetical protein
MHEHVSWAGHRDATSTNAIRRNTAPSSPHPASAHPPTHSHSLVYARKHAHSEPTPARHAWGGREGWPPGPLQRITDGMLQRCTAVSGCGGTHGACTSPRDQEASASSEDAANRKGNITIHIRAAVAIHRSRVQHRRLVRRASRARPAAACVVLPMVYVGVVRCIAALEQAVGRIMDRDARWGRGLLACPSEGRASAQEAGRRQPVWAGQPSLVLT